MRAKLIFFKKKDGIETFNFCPIVHIGCDHCPLPDCTGERDVHVAFNLEQIGENWQMNPISVEAKYERIS